jgi:uncharacterized damage-inducible protein DinB
MAEIDEFVAMWDAESAITTRLLQTLPAGRLDARPYAEARSIGEVAWHLAELEAIMSTIAAERHFQVSMPAGLERPATAAEIADGYQRVHRESVARVRAIDPATLGVEFPFFGGGTIRVRDVLRFALLHHLIHHRGQLMMLIRMADGIPARVYGPNREDDVARREPADDGEGSDSRS